jgi:chromosome segregation ATPase
MEYESVENLHTRAEAEVGIIEEITLINFMCHKHLNLKFGPNINFIVGQNGSTHSSLFVLTCKGGKSAVLVAISVGLGAKAGFTARGSKLSDLIRGQSQYFKFTFNH